MDFIVYGVTTSRTRLSHSLYAISSRNNPNFLHPNWRKTIGLMLAKDKNQDLWSDRLEKKMTLELGTPDSQSGSTSCSTHCLFHWRTAFVCHQMSSRSCVLGAEGPLCCSKISPRGLESICPLIYHFVSVMWTLCFKWDLLHWTIRPVYLYCAVLNIAEYFINSFRYNVI